MNTNQPQRKSSPRLKEFNYSQPGMYFVTLSTQNHIPFFGDLINGNTLLNDAGKMVKKYWVDLPDKFPMIFLDEFILMPNHLHGIICIGDQYKNKSDFPSPSLSKVIQWYKTKTTNAYIIGVKKYNWVRFNKHLWQRSFYDHIIQDDKDLYQIREYIHNNPCKPHIKC